MLIEHEIDYGRRSTLIEFGTIRALESGDVASGLNNRKLHAETNAKEGNIIELPSDYSGEILEICVEVDDQVNVGAVICQIDAIEEEKIEDLKAFRIKMIEILELESDAGLEVIIDAVGKLKMDNK